MMKSWSFLSSDNIAAQLERVSHVSIWPVIRGSFFGRGGKMSVLV